VIDTLPSMMNALRMVWIISRHYNRDDHRTLTVSLHYRVKCKCTTNVMYGR